jgi:hypothetical protein
LRGNDLLIRLLGKPLCRSEVRVPIRVDVLGRLLRDGHASAKQHNAQQQLEKVLCHAFLLRIEAPNYSTNQPKPNPPHPVRAE